MYQLLNFFVGCSLLQDKKEGLQRQEIEFNLTDGNASSS